MSPLKTVEHFKLGGFASETDETKIDAVAPHSRNWFRFHKWIAQFH